MLIRPSLVNVVSLTMMMLYSHLHSPDRLRNARYAIGDKGFSEHLLQCVTHELSPYRNQLSRLVKNHFCMASASLMSKTPLPHDTMMENWVCHLTHDALVLSQKFARTPEGQASIASGELSRYWCASIYLLVNSWLTVCPGFICFPCAP